MKWGICLRVGLLFAAMSVLSACSSFVDVFSSSEVAPPAELQDITPLVTIRSEWSRDTGVGNDKYYLNLVPALAGDRIYTADAKGKISALNVQNGKVVWTADLDVAASGGPGVGDGLVVIGTGDAEVIALASNDGTEHWRTTVSSEILAVPVIAQGKVIVRTIDGVVTGLDASNGEELWQYERNIPVLTLRGDSRPVIRDNLVLVGMAGGKLLALDLDSGDVVWEATVSLPAGRSELERLADIDGDPLLAFGIVFVATYQGELAAFDKDSGRVLWRRKFSSYAGMSADNNSLYASDADGMVWALDVDNGKSRWKQEALKNRRLSSVAVLADVVAVGDFEGYVHLLSTKDGALVGRTRVGSKAITQGMLVVDKRLFVLSDDGELALLTLGSAP